MLEILDQSTDKILAVAARGTLTHEDYEAFVPMLDATVQTGNHIYLLVDIEGLEGMTAHALVDDFMTGMKYWWNFEAVAFVGEPGWEETVFRFADYLIPAEIKFFPVAEKSLAWKWLEGEYADDHRPQE